MDDRDFDDRAPAPAPHARLAAELAAHFAQTRDDDAAFTPGEQHALAHDATPPRAAPADAGTEPKPPRGRPFVKGVSGNPAGRAKGSRNKATLRVQEQLDERTDELIERLMAKALEGNVAALKFCLERVLPRTRARPSPLSLDLPELQTRAGCTQAHVALIGAVAEGELAPGDARTLAALIDKQRLRAEPDAETRAAREALVAQMLGRRA